MELLQSYTLTSIYLVWLFCVYIVCELKSYDFCGYKNTD